MLKTPKYFCEKCAKKNNWAFGGFMVYTTCDVCKQYGECKEGPPRKK